MSEQTSKEVHEFIRNKAWMARVWRWHFYAGLLFAPLLFLLAVTGAVYLFKPQFEEWMHRDLYHVKSGREILAPSVQLGNVRQAFPGSVITSYRPPFESGRTAEVGIQKGEQSVTVFVDPHTGRIVGQLNEEDRFMAKVEKLHGELMVGKAGDRLVELAASWGLILVVTGLVLWWPRNRRFGPGTLVPRLTGGRIVWRDLHAVLGFWVSSGIILLILTGLPWSGVMGDVIQKAADATRTGYPAFAFAWGPKPESAIPAKAVADVPWAAEQLPVPASSGGTRSLSVEEVMNISDQRNVARGYTIYFPEGEKGVYTVTVSPNRPEGQATLHIDQYSGKVLTDVRFKDYGPLAKAISIGIALHEGRYFGWLNQLLGLAACLGLILLTVTGIVMWWKRRPPGTWGVPPVPKNGRKLNAVTVLIGAAGLLLPLVGISLLAVWLLDFLVIRGVAALKKRWAG